MIPSFFISVAGGGDAGEGVQATTGNTIHLKYAEFDPLVSLPTIPDGLKSQPPIIPDTKMPYIVQTNGPITEDWRNELANNGVEIVSYIPDNAYLVRLSEDQAEKVRCLGSVRWLGEYHPAYKMETTLSQTTGMVDLTVTLFPGATNTYVVKLLKLVGGEVLGVAHNDKVNVVKLKIDSSYIDILASMPEVRFISKVELNRPMNDTSIPFVQNRGSTPIFTHGIAGQQEVITMQDTEINPSHPNFNGNSYGVNGTGPKVLARYVPGDSAGVVGAGDPHGGFMTGIAAGDGSTRNSWDASTYDGMAVGAQIIFQDVGNATAAAVYPPTDYYHDSYEYSEANYGSKIHSNSWGGAGPYSDTEAMIDQYIWDSQDFLIFFPAGANYGSGNIDAQASAKNIVTVGATNDAGTAFASYSSAGPASDGRLKPDVVCPGGDFSPGIHSVNNAGGYTTMSGTSCSCSLAAGSAALVRQYYREGWYPIGTKIAANGWSPSAALIKATLINGAIATGATAIPNYREGWGQLHLENSLYFSGDARKTAVVDNVNGLLTNDYVEYQYSVNTGQRLKISLVWTDYPGDPTASKMLVNDLNLLVTVPGGTQYKGNVFSGGWSAAGGSNDTLNNVECVNIQTPVAGVYTIRVTGAAVALGPQNFALVVSGTLADGYGNVFLDRTVYDDSDTITVSAEDTNNTAASIDVILTTSSGDSETVSVPATATNSSVYKYGTINTGIGMIHTGDGILEVFHGDVITATYADSSPAHDSHAYANVDFRGPVITNVHADGILPTAAIIHWDTSENANSTVYYGPTTSLGTTSYINALAINHKVILKDLTPNTIYYYDVQSTDCRGRSTRDNNGNTHYMFSTGSPGTGGNLILLVDDDDGTVSPNSGTPYELDWENNLNAYGWTFTHYDYKVRGTPTLTDMNSHTMVVWFVAEGYPQIGAADRAVIKQYLDQTVTPMGTPPMLFLSGQDIGWDMCDPAGTDRDVAWYQNYLKATYYGDDADGGGGYEVGNFQVLDVGHSLNDIYNFNNIDLEGDVYGPGPTFWPDDISPRTGGSADWGYSAHAHGGTCGGVAQTVGGSGTHARVIYDAYSHDMIEEDNDGSNDPPPPAIDFERAGILDETIQWLLGGTHPTIELTYPTGGQTISGTVSVTWLVTGADYIDLYYSVNGGQAWFPLATGLAGTSTSYAWNTAGLLTGNQYKVKVVASNVATYATLTDYSQSNTFTIIGVDNMGPKCIAGSVTADRLPTVQGDTMWFNATLTDDGRGQSNIAQVEYFIDLTGSNDSGMDMNPADGNFNSITEGATKTFAGSGSLPIGMHKLYVHGRDASNNWGPFANTTFHIIATTPYATATGPISGLTNVAAVTITYLYYNSPTSVSLYYTTNGGTLWTLAGTDTSVNGNYAWTCPASGTYGWIAVGLGTGGETPPSGSALPEAESYLLDITLPSAPTLNTVENWGPSIAYGTPTTETRYLRGVVNEANVNGLTCYSMGTTNSATAGDWGPGNNLNIFLGIRVYTRSTGGTETEISGGSLVATVSRTATGNGFQTATWTPPVTTLNTGDSIVVKVYGDTTANPTTLRATFTTEVLGPIRLEANQWTVQYWTRFAGAAQGGSDWYWGTAAYDNHITGFQYTSITFRDPYQDNTLNWTASASADVDHYNIYRSATQGGTYTLIDNVPFGTDTYVDTGHGAMPDGDSTLWWYRVRAVDVAGNEEQNDNAVPEPLPLSPYDIDMTGIPANSWMFSSFPIDISGNIQIILNDTTLGDGGTTWSVAKWFDPQDKADPWKTYRVGGTVNDLATINNQMGIWLWITANGGDFMLTTGLGGYVPGEPVSINLYAGWNMVGYPSLTEQTVANALGGTGADMVEAFQSESPFIMEVGPTYIMKPGEAYWVRVPADTVWVVDW